MLETYSHLLSVGKHSHFHSVSILSCWMLWDIWSVMVLSLIYPGFFIPLGILNITLFLEIYGSIPEEKNFIEQDFINCALKHN